MTTAIIEKNPSNKIYQGCHQNGNVGDPGLCPPTKKNN